MSTARMQKVISVGVISSLLEKKQSLEKPLVNYLANKNNSTRYETLSHMLLKPEDTTLVQNDTDLIAIQKFLLDAGQARIMQSLILESLDVSDYYVGGNIYTCLNHLPSLLKKLYQRHKSPCKTPVEIEYNDAENFTKENLDQLSAALKLFDVGPITLDLDSEYNRSREILYTDSARQNFLAVMQSTDFKFDVLSFGCRFAIVSCLQHKKVLPELLSVMKVKVLHIGLTQNPVSFKHLIEGILASELTTIDSAASDFARLLPTDWTRFFNAIKQKGIHSLVFALEQHGFLGTDALMQAFLNGLKEASCVRHVTISGWNGPCLEPKQLAAINEILAQNKAAAETSQLSQVMATDKENDHRHVHSPR